MPAPSCRELWSVTMAPCGNPLDSAMPDSPEPSQQATRATAALRMFPCEKCGALQTFRAGSHELRCDFCHHTSAIPRHADFEPREHSLADALAALVEAPADDGGELRCHNCAATVIFEGGQSAGDCPFCGTPVVAAPAASDSPTAPRSLVPFALDERAATEAVGAWLRRLRFVPAGLRRYARIGGNLHGTYLPWWTYDSQTHTRYVGERGTRYQVSVPYTVTQNGRQVTRVRRETRVRWQRVGGHVTRTFDDVLVGASRSLPRQLTDRLGPWSLEALVPYDDRYLSGFRSEVYQVSLGEGFELARHMMDDAIRRDIARDIGGDHQRILSSSTEHAQTTFKHVLLPVWCATFEFRNRHFHFAVNGQTGKVVGERPWSWAKIAATVAGGLAVVGGVLALLHRTGLLASGTG